MIRIGISYKMAKMHGIIYWKYIKFTIHIKEIRGKKMFKEILFGISSVKGPEFIKEFTTDNKQLEDLKQLSSKVKNNDKKKYIDKDIAILKYGIDGEKI